MDAPVGVGVRFEPPLVGRSVVARPRLVERLARWHEHRVTVVTAPAGYGKTTALAETIVDNRLAGRVDDRWLTCRPDDAAASSLAEGLLLTLGLAPDAAAAASHAVAATDLAATAADLLWHRSPDHVALVLDDVHHVPAGSPGAQLLEAVLAALPRNGHLVLCGRSPPPVSLARHEVEGVAQHVSADDLLFRHDELAEFAAARGTSPQHLASCGGWPALAEIVATTRSGLAGDYVWQEVLGRLPADRLRDLAVLVHLGPFDDALATAAFGRAVDLEALLRGVPLVDRTDGGDWVIHALWRHHLAGAAGGDAVAAARRRAGLALAARGDVAPAVRLLTEACAWDDLTGVVADALGAAQQPVPADVVAAWLGGLPDEATDKPVARLLAAVAVPYPLVDPYEAAAQLEAAAAAFRRDGHQGGELACLSQLGQVAWWWELPEQMADVVARVLELDAAGCDEAHGLACLARALIFDMANDPTAALAEVDRIRPGTFGPAWQSAVDWFRSTSLHHLGRPAEALAVAERALANAGGLLHAPMVETAQLQAKWFLGRVDEVLERFPAVAYQASATGLCNYEAIVAAACSFVFSVVGRVDDAARHLEAARAAEASRAIPLVDVNLLLADAMLAVATGDEGSASELLAGYLERTELDTGHAAAPQRRTLALWYVLVPSTRRWWDEADLGPSFAVARDLARALVTVRDSAAGGGGRAEPLTRQRAALLRTAGAVDPSLVRAYLPLPWATELALALVDGPVPANAWPVLDAVWPAAHTFVRAQADGPVHRRAARAVLARLPVPLTGRLSLDLLGPVELRRDGVLVDAPEWQRERVRSLLVHLAVHGSASRERLGYEIWPGYDEDAQSRNLRVTLTLLLRVLEPWRRERDASFLVRQHGERLVLHRGPELDVDLWRFDDLWHEATDADGRGAPSAALGPMRAAVALWRGTPPDLGDHALAAIEERRTRLVALAARAGTLLLTAGDTEAARRMADLALTEDEWADAAHHLAVAAHAAQGNLHLAAAALARYADALTSLGLPRSSASATVTALAARAGVPWPAAPTS